MYDRVTLANLITTLAGRVEFALRVWSPRSDRH
jgi:hypothetical protein